MRATFPDLESRLQKLPPKEYIGRLSPEVVLKRQRIFEAYLSNIVMNLPFVLRSVWSLG